MDLAGKVAIVTGGGTGIGKAISAGLAAAGTHVVVNYSRSEADAEATARELRDRGVQAIPVRADVSRADEVQAMVGRTVDELGRLDVLVNNAGTTKFVPMPDLDNMDEESWDRIMAVNVKGTFLCCKAAAEPMRRSGGGQLGCAGPRPHALGRAVQRGAEASRRAECAPQADRAARRHRVGRPRMPPQRQSDRPDDHRRQRHNAVAY